jgi:hypothetical protein
VRTTAKFGLYRQWVWGLFAVLFALLSNSVARAQIFVAQNGGCPSCTLYPGGTGTVGEYTTSGATVNALLISNLVSPIGIAVAGSDLFVANNGAEWVGEYTTSGATVNASLISGLIGPAFIAVAGSDLFVVNDAPGTVGEYTTSGATVNASLISGLSGPSGIAVVSTVSTVPTVPEPSSLALFGLGLARLGLCMRRKRTQLNS